LESSWDKAKERLRGHLFRAWTACAVLAAWVFGWLYFPEMLTWWKRTTTALIEAGCDRLPYPWGDRIEATVGNFGLWVQITLAIIALRILVWLAMSALRRIWGGRRASASTFDGVTPGDEARVGTNEPLPSDNRREIAGRPG
jgi:hypothetical protein